MSTEETQQALRAEIAKRRAELSALDRQFIGIRPDYIVEVRPEILGEGDGQMLLHGLKGLHGQAILLPRARELRPDPELLATRYERYEASAR